MNRRRLLGAGLAVLLGPAAGVAERARFEAMDLFAADFSAATVVTIYVLPELNAKLLPKLLALRPSTRIVSHDAGIGDWPFDERLELRMPFKPVGSGFSRVELWVVPARAAGNWGFELPEHGGRWTLRIAQRYQLLEVEVAATGGRDFVVPAFEILLASPYLSDLMQKGRVDEIKAVMAKSTEQGMRTFDQSLYDLYMDRKIPLEEALRHADSKTDLALRVRLSIGKNAADAPDIGLKDWKKGIGRDG